MDLHMGKNHTGTAVFREIYIWVRIMLGHNNFRGTYTWVKTNRDTTVLRGIYTWV